MNKPLWFELCFFLRGLTQFCVDPRSFVHVNAQVALFFKCSAQFVTVMMYYHTLYQQNKQKLLVDFFVWSVKKADFETDGSDQ